MKPEEIAARLTPFLERETGGPVEIANVRTMTGGATRELIFRYQPSRTQIGEVFAALRDAGIAIADLTTEESRLEDIFLELTSGQRKAARRNGATPADGRT